jgi:membrane-associated protease RseP (regulator of RpoE activity)
VKAGFSRERADWLENRMQELQVQAQQAQFEAQKNGQPFRPTNLQDQLRKEIGDAEYEKLRAGTGQPTSVQVMDVLASSAAEKAGLKPGDQIVSYAGTRVYEMGELNQLTYQGTPGEQVTVEVKRDGQTVQLQVPRGVLGLQGGGGPGGGRGGPGGPGGFGGGPPGGFGGGRNGGNFGGGAAAGGNR